ARARRGACRPELRIPRRAARTSEGGVGVVIAKAAGQLDHSELCQQDRSGVPQFFDDSGIVVEDLGLIRFCSPCSRYRFCGSEVFDPIRNPVKRASVTTGANVAIATSPLVE